MPDNPLVLLFGLPVAALVALVGGGVLYQIATWMRSLAWPMIDTAVASHTLIWNQVRERGAFFAYVCYGYQVAGMRYTGTTLVLRGRDRAALERELVRHYPVGQAIRIRYNPAEPAVSSAAHMTLRTLVQITVALVGLLVMLIVMVAISASRAR